MRKSMALTGAALSVMLALGACGRQDAGEEGPAAEVNPGVLAEGEVTAPLAEAAGPAYVGVWAGAGASCDLTPGAGEGAPIAITESEYFANDTRCILASAEPGEGGGFRIELICTDADGVEDVQQVEAKIDGETLTMRRADGAQTSYTRCE